MNRIKEDKNKCKLLTLSLSHLEGIKLRLSGGLLVTGCFIVLYVKKSIQGCKERKNEKMKEYFGVLNNYHPIACFYHYRIKFC